MSRVVGRGALRLGLRAGADHLAGDRKHRAAGDFEVAFEPMGVTEPDSFLARVDAVVSERGVGAHSPWPADSRGLDQLLQRSEAVYAFTVHTRLAPGSFTGAFAGFALVVLLAAGCSGDESSPPPDVAVRSADGGSPIDILNGMDPRTPVPLQPMMAWHQKQNMQEHLIAIQDIIESLSREDWDAVAKASSAIESSPQMQMQCEHMGAGVDGFTEMALDFHRRADAIGEAARNQDTRAVLRAIAHTLEACTHCHGTYRQDVVDAATWEARTGAAHSRAREHESLGAE